MWKEDMFVRKGGSLVPRLLPPGNEARKEVVLCPDYFPMWSGSKEVMGTTFRSILLTLNSDGGLNWGILLTSDKSTAHLKCHTSSCCR